MPLLSMTGFGSASRPLEGPDARSRIDVEIRSVNARFLELKIRQPYSNQVEQALRQRVQRRIARGRVDLGVFVRAAAEDEGGAAIDDLACVGLDEARVARVLGAVARVQAMAHQRKLELSAPNPAELLRFMQTLQRASSEAGPQPPPFLDALVDEALDQLCAFRRTEGEALEVALRQLVGELDARARSLAEALPAERERLLDKLSERVAELCGRAGVQVPEPERIAQELAVTVARGDIAEELARIDSHVQQIRQTLDAQPHPGQGKTLDFLIQELLREVTTIGSKITSHEGSRVVIEAKAAIERIREQVQNVQ